MHIVYLSHLSQGVAAETSETNRVFTLVSAYLPLKPTVVKGLARLRQVRQLRHGFLVTFIK